MEGPENETTYAFGGLCEVASIEEIMCLNNICDRMAMDTISAGNFAAVTIEASTQGIRTAEKEWNMEDQAILVKGLEPAGYAPRVLKGVKEA